MASVITAERIADLIEQAPGWALVRLTVPQARLMNCAVILRLPIGRLEDRVFFVAA